MSQFELFKLFYFFIQGEIVMPRPGSQSSIVRHKASAPGAKYRGLTLKAFTDNLRADVVRPILEKYNIQAIDLNGWMDAQTQLDILREIEVECSFEELVAIGIKVGHNYPLTPDVNSIEAFFNFMPTLYQQGRQNCSPEEQATLEKLSDAHFRLKFNVPHPPFLMYGAIYGFMQRLKRTDQDFIITIIDEETTPYIFDVTLSRASGALPQSGKTATR
jgi:hypothetical protein